jgi:chromosome segregation ATPase
MEIRVKTPTEFRDAHVTIEIRADQDEVPEISQRLTEPSSLAGRLYTQAEKQALEAQVVDLRNELNGVRGHSEGLENRVRDLVAERDALLLKVEGYDHDRKTEKKRADEASETIEIAKDRMRDLDHAKTKLTRIQDKVWKETLDPAMENRGQPAHIPVVTVGDLANAVSAVRSIVGQP